MIAPKHKNFFADCSLEELKELYVWYLKNDLMNVNNPLRKYMLLYSKSDTTVPLGRCEIDFLQAIATKVFENS